MRKKLGEAGRGGLNLLAVIAAVFAVQWVMRGHVPNLVGLVALAITVMVAYLVGSRWIEQREPVELLAKQWVTDLASGFSLGFMLFSFVILLLRLTGCYHFTGWGTASQLAMGLLSACLAACLEEIIFRGFLFRLSAKLVGTWGALAATSVLFGAAHALNKGATTWSSLAIALEAGTLLGAAYAMTQRLWLPIGLHIGWNFTEGPVYGMILSGNEARGSLLHGTLQGRDVLTGGAFGPEASILAVGVCLLTAIILMWKTVKLRRVEPSMWTH